MQLSGQDSLGVRQQLNIGGVSYDLLFTGSGIETVG